MPGESKETLLARIREALADRGEPVDLPDEVASARVIGPDEDPVAVFATRVDASGMHAHRVADEPAMLDKIVELVQAVGARRVILPGEDLPARDRLVDRLRQKNIELLSPDDPDAAFEADVGITGVHAAIAETASMCVVSGGQHRCLASLAPPCHIAVVRADQIVPDLVDWTAGAPADMPANAVLISGPSKTADIEMTLVQGVHGPGEVHVVIVG